MPDGSSIVSSRPVIKIDDSTRDALSDAAQEVIIRAPEEGLASAELRFVNWSSPDGSEPDFAFNDIALGRSVNLSFGLDREQALFSGEITGIEERYGGGAPQIVLLAEDKLHRLARKRRSRALENRSPDQVIRSI